jgi:DNA-binding transcriptional regulator/RsmH inhibitor MraZ
MPETLHFDARGRITIPKELRKRLKGPIVAILTPHGVMLRSVPLHVHGRLAAKDASGEDAAMEEAGA